MNLGVRGKLFFISLALMIFVGGLASWTLEIQFREALMRQVEDQLDHLAAAMALAVSGSSGPMLIDRLDPLADSLGEAAAVRVTIIARDGSVLGDSQVATADVPSVENHGSRPEVRDALEHGIGSSRRFSNTVHHDFLYIARLWSAAPDAGVVRLALPLEHITRALSGQRRLILLVALMGLAVSIIMIGLASHWTTKPLRVLLASMVSRSPMAGEERRARRDELARLAGSFNDLTDELQRMLDERATQNERMISLLDGMSEGVIGLDSDHRVTLANRAVQDLLGLTVSPVGRLLVEVIRAPGIQKLLQIEQAAPNEYEFVLPVTPPRRILAHAKKLDADPGSVLVLHDATEIRRLEQMRMDFVANVSHELRTPLGIIKANAETLLDGALDDRDQARIFIEAMWRQANRLDDLVRDVLDLARLENPSAKPDVKVIAVAEIANAALELIRSVAAAKEIEMTSDLDKSLCVEGHPRNLEQAVFNLLDNAVKYTPSGGRIRMSVARRGEDVRIEVEDNGPGIEPQHHDRIFERFYRVDKGRSRETGGTGLGLSVVRNAVKAMKGRTGITSIEPHGSLFWIELPLFKAEAVENQKRESAE